MTSPALDRAPVRAGEVLAGKYRVERVLGAGGMGVVVSAQHLQLDQRVALKFLLPEALGKPEVVVRFDREARASARIRSEHVARVTDVGQLDTGAPYMVMEYLEGGDLAAWLDRRGVLPVDQAVEFVLQACEAVAEAHSLGIVHRDLKPANLFCIRRPDGSLCIKVLDFGISKVSGMASSRDMGMTRTSAIVGSPFYMSPEQMHSAKSVDPRTDIWSLGVILYELLSGRVPFEAEEIPELILRVLHDTPALLSSLRSDVTAGLDAVVRRCLEKDRNHRYPAVADLVRALVPFGPTRARLSLEVVDGIVQRAAAPASVFSLEEPAPSPTVLLPPRAPTAASWGGTGAPARPGETRPRAWLVTGATAAALALATLGFFVGLRLVHVRWPPTTDAGLGTSGTGQEPVKDAAVAFDGRWDASSDAAAAIDGGVDAGQGHDAGTHPTREAGAWSWPTATTPTAATAATPQTGCDPPYFYDARGNRVFKLGCLQ